MNIKELASKNQFPILYTIVCLLFVFLLLFIANYPQAFLFSNGQSMDQALTMISSSALNIDYKEYLFMVIPLALVLIFFALKIGGELFDEFDLVEGSGKRYVSLIIIMAGLPVVFIMSFFILTGILLIAYFHHLLALSAFSVLMYLILGKKGP